MATVALFQTPDSAHRSAYLAAIRDLDSITSAAIVDPEGGTFAEAQRVITNKPLRTYASFEEMRGHEDPAMAIVTYTGSGAPDVIRPLLDAGLPVLAEKPSCVNADQFARLADVSERRNAPLMLALCNRLAPWAVEARRIAPSLGKLYAARGLALADQARIWKGTPGWTFSKPNAGGGHLIWLGIHWLDLMLHLTGDRVVEVQAQAANVGGGPIDVEDVASLNLRFASGAQGALLSGYVLDKGKQLDLGLWGSTGWLRFDQNARTMDWFGPEAGATEPTHHTQRYDELGGGYTNWVQACLRASQRETPPPVTAAEGLTVLRVIFAAYESARTGRAVSLA